MLDRVLWCGPPSKTHSQPSHGPVVARVFQPVREFLQGGPEVFSGGTNLPADHPLSHPNWAKWILPGITRGCIASRCAHPQRSVPPTVPANPLQLAGGASSSASTCFAIRNNRRTS